MAMNGKLTPCNAGIQQMCPVKHFSPEAWQIEQRCELIPVHPWFAIQLRNFRIYRHKSHARSSLATPFPVRVKSNVSPVRPANARASVPAASHSCETSSHPLDANM